MRDPSGCFAIDRHSGVLKLAKPLDREKAAKMRLEITTAELEDSLVEEKPHGASVTVNIDVKDANDNAPVFVPRECTEIPSTFSLFDSVVSKSEVTSINTARRIGREGCKKCVSSWSLMMLPNRSRISTRREIAANLVVTPSPLE